MNQEKVKAHVKKLLGNPVVKEAAGVLELAQGNYELNKNGLYVPADYSGGAAAAEKAMFPIKGKHFDSVVVDDPYPDVTGDPATQKLNLAKYASMRSLSEFHEQRTRVLETVVGALLLGKDDSTYKIKHANLEEASRLFHVRVTYYQDSQEYHVSLE